MHKVYHNHFYCVMLLIMAKQTPEKYLPMLEKLEREHDRDRHFYSSVISLTDNVLAQNDPAAFPGIAAHFADKDAQSMLARNSDMIRLYSLLSAVKNELTLGYIPFTRNIGSFRELMEHCTKLNQCLRRIEFDFTPDNEEAYTFIRFGEISPCAVSAMLYNMVSLLGHREQILLKLSADALEHGRTKYAYGFLCVIESPSEDAISLRTELESALSGL